MVQELMFENSPAMFPSSRQPMSQTAYGMNLQTFGYPQHNITYYGNQDYSQYMGDCGGGAGGGAGGGVLQQATAASCTTNTAGGPGTWSGMYGGTGVPAAGVPTHAGTRSGSSPGLDDWTTAFTTSQNMVMGGNPNSPSASTPYGYRPAGVITPGHSTLTNTSDMTFSQPTNHSPIPQVAPMQPMTQASPVSPTDMMTPGSHMTSQPPHANRQTSRAPYDWMKKQTYPAAPNTGGCFTRKTRTKDKYRIVYSEYQKVELEKEYLYSKYITIQRKAELARAIGLSERQVKIWFQNRRAKERKQKRKREESATNTSGSSDIQDMKADLVTMTPAPSLGHERIKIESGDVHSAHAQHAQHMQHMQQQQQHHQQQQQQQQHH